MIPVAHEPGLNTPKPCRQPWRQNGYRIPRGLVPLHNDGLLLPGLQKLLVSGAALYPHEIREIRQKVNPGLIGYYPSSEGGGISVLNTHEFDDVAVVDEPSEKFGETVTALIAAGETITGDALEEHCRTQLAAYKIPARYVLAGELPKTSSGKLDKAVLLEQLMREEK